MRARQYSWVICKCCKRRRLRAHCIGNHLSGYYCPGACWDTVSPAEREAATIRTYSLNGKDVSKEEFDAATKRE